MEAPSFHSRLVMGVLVLVATTTATLGLISARMSERFLMERFQQRMEFLARYLALNAEVGLLLSDQEGLGRLAGNLLSEPDVVRVTIEDVKGRPIVSVGGGGGGLMEVSSPVVLHRQEEEEVFLNSKEGEGVLGYVRLYYSTAGIEGLTHRVYVNFLITAVLLSLVAAASFMVFARRLTSPLKELARAAASVAGGDFGIRVQGGFLPETRELAKAFNHMTTAIAEGRRRLEETYQDLMEQRSMAEMGRFAMSVAHEIKNPLGIIRGSLEILKKRDVEPSTRETMIHYVEEEIDRLNRLIHNFLDFSRPKRPEFTEVDVNSLLCGLLDKLDLEWCGKDVRILRRLSDGELWVRADRDLLTQAFLNVVKNACEAVEPGGKVMVESFLEDDNVVVRITDDGPGMDEEVMARAFEPFFTSKASGTGLGLAMVRRTISQHRGHVSLQRVQEGGMRCTIILEHIDRPEGE